MDNVVFVSSRTSEDDIIAEVQGRKIKMETDEREEGDDDEEDNHHPSLNARKWSTAICHIMKPKRISVKKYSLSLED